MSAERQDDSGPTSAHREALPRPSGRCGAGRGKRNRRATANQRGAICPAAVSPCADGEHAQQSLRVGVVGIVLGRIGSMAVAAIKGWPTAVSIPAILAAVLVSMIVGIVFGFYPAWKASRLDPIEALRHE